MSIRLADDPGLRQVAEAVPKVTRRVAKLLKDMESTMYAADGVGLAAPQVGVPQRLIVVDAGEGTLHLVNPEVHEASGSEMDSEGCLSLPGLYGYVERYSRVVVAGLDIKGKPRRIVASGRLARVLQHEIDHLDGILFVDKAKGLRQVTDGEEEG